MRKKEPKDIRSPFSRSSRSSPYLCPMTFSITAQDPQSKARTGTLTTDHGPIQTPIFMPVGTAGTVKAVHQRELETDINAEIILGNTYHLYLRPGLEVLQPGGWTARL